MAKIFRSFSLALTRHERTDKVSSLDLASLAAVLRQADLGVAVIGVERAHHLSSFTIFSGLQRFLAIAVLLEVK